MEHVQFDTIFQLVIKQENYPLKLEHVQVDSKFEHDIEQELLLTIVIHWLHVPGTQSLSLPIIPATKYRTAQNYLHTHHTYYKCI